MLPVEQPFKTYTGLDGKPLNNGFVYFGLPNENPITSPVAVYWDAAGTIPAQQPLRTINGYIVRAGSPANVFFDGEYSSLVKDSKGRQVSFSATSSDFSISGKLTQFLSSVGGSAGSALIGFLQKGIGSVKRTIQDKLFETLSVLDKGAKGDGVSDDTRFFSLAAKAAAANVLPAIGTTVARSATARVNVPAGTYKLTETVDTGGTDIEWLLDPGASIPNIAYLPGIVRTGSIRYARPLTYGIFDTAVAQTIIANGDADTPPSVLGLTSSDQLGVYSDRDSVAQFISNTAPPLLFKLSSPSYTANTVSGTPGLDVRKLRVGMIIDTAHDPKYSGFVTGWSSDGSSITVDNWYKAGGTAGTPPNGFDAYVNAITKAWAGNEIVVLTPSSHAKKAAAREFDMVNNQAESAKTFSTAYASPQTWGVDSVSIGQFTSTAAFTARGNWWNGYISASGAPGSCGFQTVGLEDPGFWHRNGRGVAFYATMNEVVSFAAMANGCMELGRQDAPQITFVDFHSSGEKNDYDGRIACSGGSATSGAGTITYTATAHQFSGPLVTSNVFPGSDNTYSVGVPSNRYTVFYAATSAISTSDANMKQQVQDIDKAVLRAWSKVKFKQFKFNDAVDLKGDGARWHIGVLAQEVKAAFESEGVDPFAYGLLCYDDFGGEGLYGIRYEEALALTCAYLISRLSSD